MLAPPALGGAGHRLLTGDPSHLAEVEPAGAVDDGPVEADEVPDQTAPVEVVVEGHRAAPAQRVVLGPLGAEHRQAVVTGSVAHLVIADEPPRATGADEGTHAVVV